MMINESTVSEVLEALKSDNTFFLDVRNPDEYEEIHATGTHLLPLPELDEQSITALNLGKETSIYIICRSGARSMKACQIFNDLGYTDLTNVEGGTIAWHQAGLPVEN